MNQNIYINEIPSAELTIYDNGTPVTVVIANGAASQNKVPYTGATQNVNLGEYGISAGFVQLDTTPTTYTPAVGNMGWNDSEGTIDLLLKGGVVSLPLGQKQVARVVNGTGGNVLKSNYQVVKVTGAQGQRLQVNLAQANNDANSADTLGLIAENINNNNSGFIITSGLVENINTTGSLQSETWTDGNILYLSPTTPGAITNVKPQAPNHTVIVGFVVYAHANNGKIFVKVDNGYELDELHNVLINTGTLANGQVLKYNSSLQVWENNTDAGGITGSGTSGQVAYWNGTTTQTGSATFTFSPTAQFLVNNSVTASSAIARGTNLTPSLTASANNDVLVGLDINPTFTNGAFTGVSNLGLRLVNSQFRIDYGSSGALTISNLGTNTFGASLRFSSTSAGSASSASFGLWDGTRINGFFGHGGSNSNLGFSVGGAQVGAWFSNGNFTIGTTTDAGQKLQVTGDTLLTGSTSNGTANALRVNNSSSVNLLTVRNDGVITIGTSNAGISRGATLTSESPSGSILYFNSASTFDNTGNSGQGIVITSRATSASTAVNSQVFSIAELGAGFAPTSGSLTRTYFQINATINQTGGANGITRGLYVNPTLTAAADWRSIEWSNNTGWGLYGAGTANNYLAGRLGIGNTNFANSVLAIRANLTGTTSQAGVLQSGTVLSDVTNTVRGFLNQLNTQASSFSLFEYYHFDATQGVIGATSSVNNQYGFRVASSLTGATNNYGFYGDIASGTGRWNLYMNGTALNYLNGSLLVGTTTDAGFKLDVNGTARIQNDLTISDTRNIILATTTGTKIGTATSQKLGFWNATPIVQPTTGIAEATFVENSGGTAVNVDSTFAGYTLQQIAQALKNIGILA